MNVIAEISRWAIPILLLLIPVLAYLRKVPVYESFVAGAEDGFKTGVKILPFLIGMLVSIRVFIDSGALEIVARWLQPVFMFLGLDSNIADIIPLAIMRPLSGSGALGVATQLINQHGPDSYIGRLASTLQGSTDTTFFVLTVYFGSVGIKKYRYALKLGLIADAIGLIASVWIVNKAFY
ncbi:spore maturation protein [Desulfosporosinus sp. BICA1-9]|uniref:spore maturation protein n=1 Tax=Desulfosporosinus sp. BICA1-9 TaxID=1531958 RepID=UPI00054C0C34|nr:spore maturation protein [Desulfosporosinus sp. BICA1-9]KJS47775.1 MAG: spore maturation protein [Peptococcaceae bacterium BRH_c23]KJS81743.1 MAG: spore maturation protein [Desulfosporosinus sp. BICA1-9]HBW35531.1 spore maturation protein [Desulfosporosinus sp.]